MPDEAYWASFFHPEGVLDRLLDAGDSDCNVVEFGCGYGTFTLPAARRTRGQVTALDIETAMVQLVAQRAKAEDLSNVHAEVRDFVERGTGLADRSQGHAMVFNLLHIEAPVALLKEAFRALHPGGVLSVIHWRSDIETPRGPPMAIRPLPEQCAAWLGEAGFDAVYPVDLNGYAPYHFGLMAQRPVRQPILRSPIT